MMASLAKTERRINIDVACASPEKVAVEMSQTSQMSIILTAKCSFPHLPALCAQIPFRLFRLAVIVCGYQHHDKSQATWIYGLHVATLCLVE